MDSVRGKKVIFRGRWIGLLLLLVFSSPVLLAATFGETKPQLSSAFNNLSAKVGKISSLPCATGSAQGYLSNFQTGVEGTKAAFETESQNFLLYVTKPMEGNGKCDGGFQAVARESESRARRAERSRALMGQISSTLANNSSSNFTDPTVVFDGSEDANCANEALSLTSEIESSLGQVQQGFRSAQASLGFEANRFRDYKKINLQLAESCGAGTPDSSLLTKSQKFFTPPVGGKEEQGLTLSGSGISGKIDPDKAVTHTRNNQSKEMNKVLDASLSAASKNAANDSAPKENTGSFRSTSSILQNGKVVPVDSHVPKFSGDASQAALAIINGKNGKSGNERSEFIENSVTTVTNNTAADTAQITNGEGRAEIPNNAQAAPEIYSSKETSLFLTIHLKLEKVVGEWPKN